MTKSSIRDISLAPYGHTKIEWVKANMPLLHKLEEEFRETKPFDGVRISLSIHLEPKTAYLCKVLAAGGAQMSITGSNSLSTQDDVCAALVDDGLSVFAWHGAEDDEYNRHIEMCLEHRPNIIIDDGGDLVGLIHDARPDLGEECWGGCEETTTGVIRLKAMERAGVLKFPMVAVNDADCKHLFDNRYGTGQSVWDSIMRNTNLIVASKVVVVVGYGWCSRGIAMRASALGARVIVTEIDPIKAIEARMDGYQVMPMAKAAPLGDIFVTATGCKHTITVEHMRTMKDRAILANAGHFNVEIDMAGLEQASVRSYETRRNITGYILPRKPEFVSAESSSYEDGRVSGIKASGSAETGAGTAEDTVLINVIAEGKLANIAAADGHPAEIMDLSFAVQAMSALYILRHTEQTDTGRKTTLAPEVIDVSGEIDDLIARRRLAAWGIEIDSLTAEQEEYLNSWKF